MPITLDGTNGITTPTYGGADTSEYLVPVTAFKNRIINGAMVIDQRNAGASVSATNDGYTLDRWASVSYDGGNVTGKFTVQQNAGSVTPPAGFTNYLGVTSSAATSYGVNGIFTVNQAIEGFNVADLGWGTANAKTVTLSFWVRSSLTGTFGGSLMNAGYSRSYPFSYTISSANTWEQKSVTITGDTTGTWATNNTIGIRVYFGLGVGSNYSGTAGAWVSAQVHSATGATSVVGTNGATFYITGVQLEVGSTATSFDYRPFGTELALCQRYYQQDSSTQIYGANVATNTWRVPIYYKTTMRAVPTFGYVQGGGGGTFVSEGATTSMITIGTNGAIGSPNFTSYTASAEL